MTAPRGVAEPFTFTAFGDEGIPGLLDYSQGAQARWLSRRLRTWRHDPGIDFIVAFFHECAFSTCSGHSSDGGVREALAPLFARYQVDLAVQGHNDG